MVSIQNKKIFYHFFEFFKLLDKELGGSVAHDLYWFSSVALLKLLVAFFKKALYNKIGQTFISGNVRR